MKRSPRSGFTLFQLLILLAFLLLLLGMASPIILRAQIAANRAAHVNNLRMIGLANHNYYDTYNKLPSGVDDNHFSGLAKLLPYMEQVETYKKIDFMKAADSAVNAAARKVRIKTFESKLDPIDPPTTTSGPTNYFLVAGSRPSLDTNDGLFYLNSSVKFTEVADGLSNTLFAVESLIGDGKTKAETVARQHVQLKKEDLNNLKTETGVKEFKNNKNIVGNRGSAWIDGRFLQSTITLTREINSVRPDVDCGGEGGLASIRSLDQGSNGLLADGSVRFIKSTVNSFILKALATRSGAEVIGDY